jgi:hypothetical protein
MNMNTSKTLPLTFNFNISWNDLNSGAQMVLEEEIRNLILESLKEEAKEARRKRNLKGEWKDIIFQLYGFTKDIELENLILELVENKIKTFSASGYIVIE